MTTQFQTLFFTSSLMVAAALLTVVAAQAASIDTALQITVGGTSTCLFGGATNNVSGTACDTTTLETGAINGAGNAGSIPLTPFDLNYTFPSTGDMYNFSGAYAASYSASGTLYTVQVMVTYLSTASGGNSKGDVFSLDFLQDFYDGGPGSFAGLYTEDARPIVISPTMPASASVAVQFLWGGEGVGLLGPFVGPGMYAGHATNNLIGLAVDYLPADFSLLYDVPAGATPGSFISVNITPEPAEAVPSALACSLYVCASIAKKRRARFQKSNV